MLKSRLLIVGLLLVGFANAQEGELVVPPPPPEVSHEVIEAEIMDFPDAEAEFPGGVEAMKKYIQDNVEYPEKAAKNGDEGRVYVAFVVEPDGSITGVEIMRGATKELNEEAKRLVRSMPKWKPGEVRNIPIRSRCRLPITFVLSGGEKE
jgi:protein TonB